MRLIYLIYALPALRVDALNVTGLEHPLWFAKENQIWNRQCLL